MREGQRILLDPQVVVPAMDGRVQGAETRVVAAGGAQELYKC
jgi:hypothetical protein